jgi:hypothetical protein
MKPFPYLYVGVDVDGWVGGGGVFRNDRLAPLWKSLLRFSCVGVVGPMISSRT